MSLWFAALAALTSVVGWFWGANRHAAKAHARVDDRDVEEALAEVVDPSAPDHDRWDLFLAWPIDDPYLESIRLECSRICREHPPPAGEDISEKGRERVSALLVDLRRRISAGSRRSGGVA